MMSLGMLIPSVIGTFNQLSGVWKTLQAVTILNNAALDKNTIAQVKNIAVTKGLTIAEAAEEAVKKGLITAEEAESISKTKVTGATVLKTIADGALGVAEGILTGITYGLAGAFMFLELTLGPIGATLVAITAAIGLLIGAETLLNTIIGDNQVVSLNKAREETEKLGQTYNNIKNKYEDLKSSLEDYRSAQQAINELKEGTVEWADAIREANDKVLQLMDNYPELAQYVTNEDGRLQISREGQDIVLANQKAEMTRTFAVSSMAKQKENKIENQNLISTAGKDIKFNSGEENTPFKVMSSVGTDTISQVLTALKENGNSIFASNAEFAKTTRIANEELINALIDNKEDILTLANQLESNDKTNELLDTTIAQQIIANSDLNETMKQLANNNEEESEIGKEAYQQELNRSRSQVLQGHDISDMVDDFNIASGFGKQIFDQYMELHPEISKSTNFTGDSVKYKYTDEKDQIQEAEVSFDTIINELAVAGMNLQNIVDSVVQQQMEDYPQLLEAHTQLMSGLNEASQQTLDKLLTEVDWSNPEEAIQRISDAMTAVGVSINPEALQAYADAMAAINVEAGMSGDLSSDAYNKMSSAETNYTEAKEDYAVGDISAEELSEAQQALIDARQEYLDAVDKELNQEIETLELDTDELEDMTDYIQENAESLDELSDSLKINKTAAKEVAKEIARFDRAIEEVRDNYDDWKKSLASKDIQEQTKVIKELRKNYGDLLDIDGSQLSQDFITNTHNLDLMKKAAEGNTEAYKELMELARQDLAIKFGIDDSEFQSKFNDLMNKYYEGQNLDDIEVGASLDNQGFLDGLTDMVNAAGLTAEQAQEYLASMGIDAEVETKTQETPETPAYNLTPNVSTRPIHYTPIRMTDTGTSDGTPSMATATVPVVTYTSTPVHTTRRTGGTSLKVTSAKKSSGGGFKFKNSTNGGGSGGSKGKGGGGGGGGGGGSEIQKKDLSKADRGNRYHIVKQRQANTSRQQDDTNRKKERAFGAEKIKQSEAEIKLQKEQIKLQREYLDEIDKNLKLDRKDMESAFKDLKINLNIDKEGIITNYDEVQKELLRQTNELEKKYNAGGIDDDAFEEAKKKIDNANEALENYEETLELQNDEIQTLKEQLDDVADMVLELAQLKIELKLDINEDAMEYLEYMLNKLDDDAYSTAKAIALIGAQTDNLAKKAKIYQEGLNSILSLHGLSINNLDKLSNADLVNAGFTADEIDTIKDYKSGLLEVNETLLEMRPDIVDRLANSFSEFTDEIQRSYEEFEYYNDILEHFSDIVDLLGPKLDAKTQALLKSIRSAQLQNARMQATSAKEIYLNAEQQNRQAQKLYNQALKEGNEAKAREYKKLADETEEVMRDSYTTWLDSFTQALEYANNIYEAQVETIQRTFEEAITGMYGTFDLFDAAYERIKEQSEFYVNDSTKFYELNKLYRDIQKSIDDSSSIKDKQALRNIQQQITDAQEKGIKLSEYDIDVMRKKFELEQARINLENARNNKSEVRLQRDASGNWGYVYTASEDAVSDAEQKYEDALYNYQKTSEQYIDDLQERLQALPQTYQEAFTELINSDKFKAVSEAEQKKMLEELWNSFDSTGQYLIEQLNNAMENLNGTLGVMSNVYGQEGELIDTFAETPLGKLIGTNDAGAWVTTIGENLKTLTTDLTAANKELYATTNEIADKEGLTMDEINQKVKGVGTSAKTTQKDITNLINVSQEKFTEGIDALKEWEKNYGNTTDKIVKNNERIITSLDLMIAKLSTIASSGINLNDFVDLSDISSTEDKKSKKTKTTKIASKESGGYTGEWGPEGRLAILHEKEFVLDKTMTSGLLDLFEKETALMNYQKISDKYVDRLNSEIIIEKALRQLNSAAEAMNFSSLNSNNYLTRGNIDNSSTLDQTVTIEANFPNATNHNEIELAFDNLVNKAAQYANRKNMSAMTFQDSYTSVV